MNVAERVALNCHRLSRVSFWFTKIYISDDLCKFFLKNHLFFCLASTLRYLCHGVLSSCIGTTKMDETGMQVHLYLLHFYLQNKVMWCGYK